MSEDIPEHLQDYFDAVDAMARFCRIRIATKADVSPDTLLAVFNKHVLAALGGQINLN